MSRYRVLKVTSYFRFVSVFLLCEEIFVLGKIHANYFALPGFLMCPRVPYSIQHFPTTRKCVFHYTRYRVSKVTSYFRFVSVFLLWKKDNLNKKILTNGVKVPKFFGTYLWSACHISATNLTESYFPLSPKSYLNEVYTSFPLLCYGFYWVYLLA